MPFEPHDTMTNSSILSRQSRRAKARHSQERQKKDLTDQIMTEAATKTAAAAAAAAITQAYLTDAELRAWNQDMEARLKIIQQHPEQNLGHIEEQIAILAREPLRLMAQRAAQATANATPCQCPQCQHPLTCQKHISRSIDSRFGSLAIWRRYGWCAHCQKWHFPADYALASRLRRSALKPWPNWTHGRISKSSPAMPRGLPPNLSLWSSKSMLLHSRT